MILASGSSPLITTLNQYTWVFYTQMGTIYQQSQEASGDCYLFLLKKIQQGGNIL